MPADPTPAQASVTATQLVRDFPEVRRLADLGPVQITSHGRAEAVVLSPHDFRRLSAGHEADASGSDWKLALALDTIETHILILDKALNIRQANRAICEAFSLPVEEVIGKHVAELITRPTDQFVVHRLKEALETGQTESIVVPSSRRPGCKYHYVMKPWPDGVALFADDITDREIVRNNRTMENAAEKSVASLSTVGNAHVQANGTIISSSLGFCQIVGSSAESLAGVPLQRLFEPESRAIVSAALVSSSAETQNHEVRYLREGVTPVGAMLAVTGYWTPDDHACAAIAMQNI